MGRPLAILVLLMVTAGLARAGLPARPTAGHGSNFYLSMGVASPALDLDPRGADDFVAAGLDPHDPQPQVHVGVGWVFARPLRLSLTVGGGEVEVDREGLDAVLGRALATLHLAVAESRWAVLEVDFSLGSQVLAYDGLPDEEVILGVEAGLGVTGRVRLMGELGLEAGYRDHLIRYERANLDLSDDERISLHPAGRHRAWRVAVTWDL